MNGVYAADAIDRARAAGLACDARWPWKLPLLRVRPVPGPDAPRPVKKRLGKRARDEVAEALADPATQSVGLGASTSERDNNGWIYIDTGHDRASDGRYPFNLRAMCRAPEDRPEAMAAWLEVAHELSGALGLVHGTIAAASDEAILRCEVWAQHESRDGRDVHPNPGLLSSLANRRHGIGDAWIRPPRWGTYLRPEHVAALGGRDRIVDVVKPPVVREIGELLYVQLSEHPRDALAEPARAKQRAFEDLAAPLVVPPL